MLRIAKCIVITILTMTWAMVAIPMVDNIKNSRVEQSEHLACVRYRTCNDGLGRAK